MKEICIAVGGFIWPVHLFDDEKRDLQKAVYYNGGRLTALPSNSINL